MWPALSCSWWLPAGRRKVALDPSPHRARERCLQSGRRQPLQQSLLVSHPVPGELARELEVLFPARRVLGDREVVDLEAQAGVAVRIRVPDAFSWHRSCWLSGALKLGAEMGGPAGD